MILRELTPESQSTMDLMDVYIWNNSQPTEIPTTNSADRTVIQDTFNTKFGGSREAALVKKDLEADLRDINKSSELMDNNRSFGIDIPLEDQSGENSQSNSVENTTSSVGQSTPESNVCGSKRTIDDICLYYSQMTKEKSRNISSKKGSRSQKRTPAIISVNSSPSVIKNKNGHNLSTKNIQTNAANLGRNKEMPVHQTEADDCVLNKHEMAKTSRTTSKQVKWKLPLENDGPETSPCKTVIKQIDKNEVSDKFDADDIEFSANFRKHCRFGRRLSLPLVGSQEAVLALNSKSADDDSSSDSSSTISHRPLTSNGSPTLSRHVSMAFSLQKNRESVTELRQERSSVISNLKLTSIGDISRISNGSGKISKSADDAQEILKERRSVSRLLNRRASDTSASLDSFCNRKVSMVHVTSARLFS